MYNLSDINTIRRIISKHGFNFKKSLGQNFLTDDGVCPAMAEYSQGKNVLEIGPGIGVLTVQLAERAKKVVSIELDRSLELYEEGIGLVRLCSSMLDNAEKKIKILQSGEGGELIEKDFDNE